jgi:hypothetical protein
MYKGQISTAIPVSRFWILIQTSQWKVLFSSYTLDVTLAVEGPAPITPAVGVPDRTFWEAISTMDKAEQRVQVQRLHLQNTIEDLLNQLDEWCSAPLQAVYQPSTPSDFPTSATRYTSRGAEYEAYSPEILKLCVAFLDSAASDYD